MSKSDKTACEFLIKQQNNNNKKRTIPRFIHVAGGKAKLMW